MAQLLPNTRAGVYLVFALDRQSSRQPKGGVELGRLGVEPYARSACDVVPVMAPEDVLANRLTLLRGIVLDSCDEAPAQVQGFVLRVLESESRFSYDTPLYKEKTVDECLETVRFDGYPALARAGYRMARVGHPPISGELVEKFLHCIEQQRGRPAERQAELAGDALALLGIADGLRSVSHAVQPQSERLQSAKLWARELVEQHGGPDNRLRRVRLLANDILEDQGRFGRQLGQSDDEEIAVLDLCLWRSWPNVLRNVGLPGSEKRQVLVRYLLTAQPPQAGEVVHAASWLCALDVLISEIAGAAVPNANHVARILAATQGSFRRWRWEKSATRRGVIPTRWLIDKEADVQAFLLAVLYPYFIDQLEDEQYLQGFGLRQGRFDFAITSLGLIVEVKVIRKSSNVRTLEAEIADDLALYFKEQNPFKTMIVYIYDDRDKPEPENYPAISDALKRRSDRIVDVVIVQRPSMIPGRNDRQ